MTGGVHGLNPGGVDVYYGWMGVKITNDADATGEVVGYGFESQLNTPITAGAMSPGLSGDYNGNLKVDAADYAIWRKHSGLMSGATAAEGDGNGDGEVDTSDLRLWQAQYGESIAASAGGIGTSSVPEPGSILLALVGGLAMLGAFIFRRIRRP